METIAAFLTSFVFIVPCIQFYLFKLFYSKHQYKTEVPKVDSEQSLSKQDLQNEMYRSCITIKVVITAKFYANL